MCFTWAGDMIWTAVDAKPKGVDVPPRLREFGMEARVAFLVDRWDEDWGRLAWLQARGRGHALPEGPEAERARQALLDKYPQYQSAPPTGPVIRIDVDDWQGWDPTVQE